MRPRNYVTFSLNRRNGPVQIPVTKQQIYGERPGWHTSASSQLGQSVSSPKFRQKENDQHHANHRKPGYDENNLLADKLQHLM